MKKGDRVTPDRVSEMFGATKDRRCIVLRAFWYNGEGWLELKDELTGDKFTSPDVFWSLTD